jgi:hypothetical protein
MLQNITNFFNLIRGNKIKTTPDGSDLIPLGTRDPRFDGFYQPTGITVDDFVASLPVGGGVIQLGTGTCSSVRISNNNTASGYVSTVSGGYCNTASSYYSTVSGGRNNTASNYFSTVGGGRNNTASGYNSIISGGSNNTVSSCA